MSSFRFGERSKKNAEGVHPDLVGVMELALSYTPYDFSITEGVRSPERQALLFKQGFSKVEKGGMHEVQPDGYGHAIDVMAVGDLNGDGKVDHRDTALTWDKTKYTAIANAVKRAAAERGVKLRWGGDFKTFFDGPHFELVA